MIHPHFPGNNQGAGGAAARAGYLTLAAAAKGTRELSVLGKRVRLARCLRK